MKELHDMALKLRAALEDLPADMPVYQGRFPAGCCSITCDILIRLMLDSGYTGMRYICASSSSDHPGLDSSHAWVEYRGHVIDLTADQFSDRIDEDIPKVIFTDKRDFYETYFNEDVDVYDEEKSEQRAHKFSSNTFYAPYKDIYTAVTNLIKSET